MTLSEKIKNLFEAGKYPECKHCCRRIVPFGPGCCSARPLVREGARSYTLGCEPYKPHVSKEKTAPPAPTIQPQTLSKQEQELEQNMRTVVREEVNRHLKEGRSVYGELKDGKLGHLTLEEAVIESLEELRSLNVPEDLLEPIKRWLRNKQGP